MAVSPLTGLCRFPAGAGWRPVGARRLRALSVIASAAASVGAATDEAGITGPTRLGDALGESNLIVCDMGGTTAKALLTSSARPAAFSGTMPPWHEPGPDGPYI